MHVIVIGSGIAALALMRQLNQDIQITCITQNKLNDNNSYDAQGGICFSKYEEDQGQSHIDDTYHAGVHSGDLAVIRSFISESDAIIQQLIDEGLPFDRNTQGDLLYGMEGAHSHARILHAGGDQTGRIIAKHLASHLYTDNLTLIENMEVVDLIRNEHQEVCGVVALNHHGEKRLIEGDAVVCATGGISNLFTPSSNQRTSISTGAILAFHHHVPLQNMEMIQFHPTLLGTQQRAYGLVSEAVRGAGAMLVNEHDIPFMDSVHPLKSLAPRDITSRAIFHQQKQGHQCYLDISQVHHFTERFPTIAKSIKAYDPSIFITQRIPVTLGAHYTIGGIKASMNGRTNLPRFFAIGEAACTHFHGANRLASNSLLEGLVMGVQCAKYIQSYLKPIQTKAHYEPLVIPKIDAQTVQILQNQSSSILGVERNGKDIASFISQIDSAMKCASMTTTLTLDNWQHYCTLRLLQIVAHAALKHQASRGVHYRIDYPNQDDTYQITEIYNGGNKDVQSITRQRETSTVLHRR
ncbi:FAD-binding protein [Staphylococcus felis]|uniref:L-aspartate oxidase n=1 Tax=Staphylococcus felis TaxID=46127 RepID=UPI003966B8A1